jgi:hypothetical protein
MDIIELALKTRYSGLGRRKFGRIYQRFWFVHCCGSRRLQSEQIRPGRPCALRDRNFLLSK